ncbi:MAG: OprO/OprP family phosphate-selective porin [Holophagaceae bacterium]|nr:OprO/OprP family phosphate-selective porin [Holophagaceae bacterium]
MFNSKKITLLPLVFVAGLPAVAQVQAPKIGGLAQIWYTQMMDNSLRHFSSPFPYYPTTYKFPGGTGTHYNENGFSLKRIELSASGAISDNVEYRIMYDVSLQSGILQDVYIKYKAPMNVEFQVGQFKILGLDAATIAPMNMLFVEHSQLGLLFGSRDRGASASIGFGNPEAFSGRAHVAVFNGSGKNTEVNAQKDLAIKADFRYGKKNFFGIYSLQGSTNQADAGNLTAGSFGSNGPSASTILDNKDKTTVYGAFYEFDNSAFYGSAEVATGTLGRFFRSLNVDTAQREHLDQTFLGINAVAGYTFGHHKIVARYNNMNYNYGDDWYGTVNPYVLPNGDDISPNYTEITGGYIYAFNPASFRSANIKVNYTMRSKNFLINPTTGAATGGDTLSVAFQVSF